MDYSKFVTDEILDEIASVAKVAWNHGWAESSAGNLSLRLNVDAKHPKSDLVLITGTGIRMRELAENPGPETLGLFERGGQEKLECLWGSGKQTSEWFSHFEVHNVLASRFPEKRAVLHVHPTYTLAWLEVAYREIRFADSVDGTLEDAGHTIKKGISFITGKEDDHEDLPKEKMRRWGVMVRRLLSRLEESHVYLKDGVDVVEGMGMGSEGLATATSTVFKSGCGVVLWPKHGAIAVGEDLQACLDKLEVVDKAAKVDLLVRASKHV